MAATPQKAQGPVWPVATLQNAVIPLVALRDSLRKELVSILNITRGSKGLVLDPALAGPVGLIARVEVLREQGVDKIYMLEGGQLETDCRTIIYITRPNLEHMRFIASQVKSQKQRKDYYIFFVPRRNMLCENILKEENVYEDVQIGEYHMDLVPFDSDILSMELPNVYKDAMIEGDRTSLFFVAKSLLRLQRLYGVIPQILGKGNMAKSVTDMMARMRLEMGIDSEELSNTPEIDQLILIDRHVDMVTPLCTQLTYEGLIDESFGIANTYCDLPIDIALTGEVLEKAKNEGRKTVKTPLNSNDRLYSEIRDVNFSVVGPTLHRKAQEIGEYYDKRHQAENLSQLRDFMRNLGTTQQVHLSLKVHANLTENILLKTKTPNFMRRLEAEQSLLLGTDASTDYIEEAIFKQVDLRRVLRLCCLYSVTNGGLPEKKYQAIKRQLIHTYGYQYLETLLHLEKVGIFKSSEKSNFATLRTRLRLVVPDVDENNPQDISYVFSGYAPLSVRLIEKALTTGWDHCEELNLIPGPYVNQSQPLPHGIEPQQSPSRKPVTLIFYLGGITYAEIAAIRFLSQRDENRDYLIATTKIINGNNFIDSLTEPI